MRARLDRYPMLYGGDIRRVFAQSIALARASETLHKCPPLVLVRALERGFCCRAILHPVFFFLPSDVIVEAHGQLETSFCQPRKVDLGECPVSIYNRLEARQGVSFAGRVVVA